MFQSQRIALVELILRNLECLRSTGKSTLETLNCMERNAQRMCSKMRMFGEEEKHINKESLFLADYVIYV